MKIEKLGKMISIFEFSLSKLGNVSIFMKILWKIFDPFLKHFWLIEGKIKIKMKKFGKMSSNIGFSISKLGCM